MNKILFGVILILLLLVKLLHFYYSSYVYNNIDDFILVYNHIKKSNLLILFIPLLNKNNLVKSLLACSSQKKISNRLPTAFKVLCRCLAQVNKNNYLLSVILARCTYYNLLKDSILKYFS